MVNKKVFGRQLLEGSFEFTLPILEQAMKSNALRPFVMKKFEKLIRDQSKTSVYPGIPPHVRKDKIDMALALLGSANRALERRQIAPKVLHQLLKTFLANTILEQDEKANAAAKRFEERHRRKPPSLLVISPTKTCNLHCNDCYASSGSGAEHLEWDVFDRIITEGKELWGVRFFVISGGEPLLYRSQGKSLLDAVMKHSDCFFQMYTNGTLIDEQMAECIADAGNLIPAISVEGFEVRTDGRRGAGVFQRVLKAMANLRQVGVPFAISLTATRNNAQEILSDKFINFFFNEQQAVFGWLFQYMPIGRSYTLDLLVTPEQRLWMWRRTWQIIRERKIMLADFWNCGTAANGCIAAGRSGGYLYIDWSGKVMPCAFVPYSPANIHEIYQRGGTIDDIYELPYLQAIRQWQWEYALGKEKPEKCGNLLLPCSLRDNFAMGRGLIDTYHPEPEDEAAAEALRDDDYYEGMIAYNEALRKLLDPIWEQEYLQKVMSMPLERMTGCSLDFDESKPLSAAVS